MKKKKSFFPPDVDSYLGKYKIEEFTGLYDATPTIMVICENGRMFGMSPEYGINALESPYNSYNKNIERLIKTIRKERDENIPYMDRKMRKQ